MNTQVISDHDLIHAYLNGNQSSLEQLIRRHQNRIFAYILMTVKDKSLADDIFQDTFIKVINTLRGGTYKEEGKFIQWVMRIAHNLIIDHFRKAKRLPVVEVKDNEYDVFNTVELAEDTVEQKMIIEQIHEDVRKMIEYLPEEQKEVLVMRAYQDMSFKDIAEQTDVSINTALGRMRYALINLRKIAVEKDIILTV